MKKVKDSAPGKDDVRMAYKNCADIGVKQKIVELIQFMFEQRANKWEDS